MPIPAKTTSNVRIPPSKRIAPFLILQYRVTMAFPPVSSPRFFKKSVLFSAVFTLLPCFPGCAESESFELFVAPDGSDTATGTKSAPFATLVRARDEIRKLKQENSGTDFTIWLRGGIYHISETLVLGKEDSAAPGHRITWRNYPNERPVLSGGLPITDWQPAADLPGNIWMADLPTSRRNLTLYRGEKRLPRARGKGFVPLRQYDTWKGPHTDTIEFPAGALKNYEDLQHAEIVARTSAAWAIQILPLREVDEEKRVARTHPGSYSLGRIRHRPTPPDAMWIENVLQELDEPGEWVVHSDEGKLYYWPIDSEKPEHLIVPTVSEIIRVEGEIDYEGSQDLPVRGLDFKGLTFLHGDRMEVPEDINGTGLQHGWDYFDYPNAMLRFRGAEDCSVDDCRFAAAGDNGIRLDLHAQNIVIKNSLFEHLGGAAAVFAGYGLGTKDTNKENVFTGNHVHHVGEIKWDRPALFIWQSGSNRIAHNLFHNVPYIGISVSCRADFEGQGESWRSRRDAEITGDIRLRGRIFRSYEGWKLREKFWHGKDNLVENNEFFSVMEIMGDGNAIYVSGTGGGNVIRRNYIHNVWSSNMDAAIRCDDDQHETLIEENIIFNNASGGNGITIKGRNDVINNFLVNIHQAPGQRHYGLLSYATFMPDGSTIERNIFYSPDADWIRPVLTGQGRILKGTSAVVQVSEPIDLRNSQVRNNLFWSPALPAVRSLIEGSGGSGWKSGWIARALSGTASLDPLVNLRYQTAGYANTGKEEGNDGGGALRQRGHWALLARAFSDENISDSVLWISFLINRSDVNSSYSDRTGVFLALPENSGKSGIYIGTQGKQFGIGTSSGIVDLGKVDGNHPDETHLVIARIDLTENSVAAWFNPIGMTSIEALGEPHVFNTNPDFRNIEKTLEIRMEGKDTSARMHFDAFRIAHGTSSEESFSAVATGVATENVTLIFEDFDLEDPEAKTPPWASDYLSIAHASGYEEGSRIADPMFVDVDQGDFRFRPGSPAPEMGIVSIDRDTMGIDYTAWTEHLAGSSRSAAEASLREAQDLGRQMLEKRQQETTEEGMRDLNYIP